MIGLRRNGFTLVELIVVVGVLVIFATGVLFVLNPFKQLNKTYDAERINDLNTITTALDTYYQDKQCYPTSIPFGQGWSLGNTTYMAKVPDDPQTSTNGGYAYITDTSNKCSQWNILFAKLTNSQDTSVCELPPSCLPHGYTNQWACKVSGEINCPIVTAYSLPTAPPSTFAQTSTSQGASPTQSGQNISTQIVLPTPTPTPNILSQTATVISDIINSPTVEVCHATGTDTWDYVNAPANASVGGYGSNPYDIIPPFEYVCSGLGICNYPGKNWNTDTNVLWLENCQDLYNADANGTLHAPDGTWCNNSNTGAGDWIRQISCTDNTGVYASVCYGNYSGGADMAPGCRVGQTNTTVTLHQFTAGCLALQKSIDESGASLVCSNLDQVIPGVNSVCSSGMCTGLPSSVLAPPTNISFNSLPNFGPIGGDIKANTILDIEPTATDPTHIVGIRMITVSVNGQLLCRRLPPQISGCIWNVPSSIPANQNNKIDIQITATSGEGATATQDFYYKLVQ